MDVESQQQAHDHAYYQARSGALQGIESTVHELGSLYQQLIQMIASQGEVVQRIDQNIDEMSLNVKRGQKQLERYLRRLSSGQWLMIKTFGVLLVFVIVFCILFT